MRIHLLHGTLKYFNTKALIFPFVKYNRVLRSLGYEIYFFSKIQPGLEDCNWLLVDSKYFRDGWVDSGRETLDEISDLALRANKIGWLNTGDSTGGIQLPVLDIVDVYFKNQLLRDRKRYLKSFYGARIYTDYYSKLYGVVDKEPIENSALDSEQIKKLKVSWNLGLNPNLRPKSRYLDKLIIDPRLFRLISHPIMSGNMARFGHTKRPFPVHCRISTRYDRATIAFQRQKIEEMMASLGVSTKRVGRSRYYRELAGAQLVLSPFGWGEICIRDFEAIYFGGTLVKPSMDHVDTWPDVYKPGLTYISIPWEIREAEVIIKEVLESSGNQYSNYAHNAAAEFISQVGPTNGEGFAEHLGRMLSTRP